MKTINDDQVMSSRDFVCEGFLQEINRRVLHPAGVNASLTFDGRLDIHYLPPGSGGYVFAEVVREYAEKVHARVESNAKERTEAFRDVVQPVELSSDFNTTPDHIFAPKSSDAVVPYNPGMTVASAMAKGGLIPDGCDVLEVCKTSTITMIHAGYHLKPHVLDLVFSGDVITVEDGCGNQREIRIK